ncbi:MAG: nuclear transport factor 2 family protein [Bacteroidales bacterium]
MDVKKIVTILFTGILLVPAQAQKEPDKMHSVKTGQVQSSASQDKQEILKIIEKWKGGYNNNEAAMVARLYSKDAYYLTQHYVTGIVHGRKAIQAYVQLGANAKYRIESIRPLYVSIDGNFAYVITRYDADNGGVKVFGVNLVVLNKTGGKWLIVAHEAAVPDPNTAIQSLDTLNIN